MIGYGPDSLFQLQTNLIDMKVDMAANTAIERVVDQIRNLKDEMGGLRHEMHAEFFALGNRVTAIETKLGMVTETRKAVFDRVMDYIFKTVWTLSAVVIPYVAYVVFQLK